MSEIKTIPAGRFLYETGLLFEINRRILHPLGLAMQVTIDDQEGALSEEDAIIALSNELWDYRDDPEGMIYGEESLENGFRKYRKFWKEFGEKKILERAKLLGFTVQSTKDIEESTQVTQPLTQQIPLKQGINDAPKVSKPEISPPAQGFDEEIENLKKKNSSMKSSESISSKIKTVIKDQKLTASAPLQTDTDKGHLKKIQKYLGKEHKKPSTGKPCISTEQNTVHTPIGGGPAIVLCTECGATLRDPDIEGS